MAPPFLETTVAATKTTMNRAIDKWTDEEVKAHLAIYASEEIQRGFEGLQRNIKIFATITCQFSPYFSQVLFCFVVECGAKVTHHCHRQLHHISPCQGP